MKRMLVELHAQPLTSATLWGWKVDLIHTT
jgi:hypothetical protein